MHVFNALDALSNAIKLPIQRGVKGESKGLLTDIVEGITYQEGASYSEILKNMGSENGAVNFIAGLALEIIADPLNYIPVAGQIKAGQEAVDLVKNINKADVALKGKTLIEADEILKATKDIRDIDKSVLRLSGARLKGIRPLGIDTGIMAYTLDDLIFGAAFKGIGRGARATFKGIEKISPDAAKQLSGLGRFGKSLFKNSANINKASKQNAKIAQTIAEQTNLLKKQFRQYFLIFNPLIERKNINGYSEELVKKGVYKTSKEAFEAVSLDMLKFLQNTNDTARTLPEIFNSLALNTHRYTVAKNIDEIMQGDDVLSETNKTFKRTRCGC